MDVSKILARARDYLVVDRAFGNPVEHGGGVVVPVAIVIGGGGGGKERAAASRDREGRGEGRGEGRREGRGGGGFGGVVYPLGVYSIRAGRVRFVPAVNVTRIVVAVLLVVRTIAKRWTKVTVVNRGPGLSRHERAAKRSRGDAHTGDAALAGPRSWRPALPARPAGRRSSPR